MFKLDKRWILLIYSLAFLLFPACTLQPGSLPDTGAGQTTEAEHSLANTIWMLVAFGEPGAETPVIEGSTITLEFDAKGQAGGMGGCNSYGGSYSVNEGKLKFGEIVSTLIACTDQAITDQEQQYLQALRSASRFTVNDTGLTILYNDEKGVLNFVRASTPTPDSSQSQERIEFDLGYSSATRIGDLPEGGMKEYVVSAAAGQTMHIQTVGYNAPVEFTLSGPSGEIWTSEQQASDVNISTAQVNLPQDGDYVVRLMVPPDARHTDYEITFTIETTSVPTILPPAEPPETVEFASGATLAQRSGMLPSGPALKQYALAGKAGQTLTVEVNGADVPISISFTTPGGMTGSRSGHKFLFDENGIYLVTLSKFGETPSTDYTVVFTIQ